MSDGETFSPVEIREITDRALRIQRFLLRRAWGAVYAALSISMFMTVFGTPIAARLGLPEFAIVSLVIVHMPPPDSPVLVDMLREPDSMPVESAEILIPHYLQRLERELEKYETRGAQLLLRPS